MHVCGPRSSIPSRGWSCTFFVSVSVELTVSLASAGGLLIARMGGTRGSLEDGDRVPQGDGVLLFVSRTRCHVQKIQPGKGVCRWSGRQWLMVSAVTCKFAARAVGTAFPALGRLAKWAAVVFL